MMEELYKDFRNLLLSRLKYIMDCDDGLISEFIEHLIDDLEGKD